MGSLESREMFDPTGLQSQIAELQGREMFDPTGLQSQISALQNRQMFDPTGLQARIGDLEGRQMFDPSGLKSRISQLENQFQGQQPQPPQQINMADVEALIEQRLGNMSAFGLQADPNFKKDPGRPDRMFIGQGGPGGI
jgi:hypothetical protein